MSETPEPMWVARTGMRPGGLALRCGFILFGMGLAVFAWERYLIDGPAEEQLVPTPATLLSVRCDVQRGSPRSNGLPNEFGALVVRYEYTHQGRVHQGDRYQRQRDVPPGSVAQCRQLESDLGHRPAMQAWIDPAQPGFSTLTKHLQEDPGARIFMGLGAALTVLGVYRRLRMRRAEETRDRT